jgi:hypothetical protein
LINDALQLIEMLGAPMADWRIHRTAAHLLRAQGLSTQAIAHEQLFQQKAQRLLHDLPTGHRLQESFARLIA